MCFRMRMLCLVETIQCWQTRVLNYFIPTLSIVMKWTIFRTSSIPHESTREPVATFRCCLHTTRVRECFIVLYSIVTLAYCKSRIQR